MPDGLSMAPNRDDDNAPLGVKGEAHFIKGARRHSGFCCTVQIRIDYVVDAYERYFDATNRISMPYMKSSTDATTQGSRQLTS